MGENTFYFDVDQTLARGIVAAHLKFYNHQLNLGMSEREIREADSTFASTFEVPRIVDFRSQDKDAEDLFQKARKEIRTSEQVHLAFKPMPYSQSGVKQLLQSGDLGGYYTVRPKEIEKVTKDWLIRNRFPDANLVQICDSPEQKLKLIAENVKGSDQNSRFVLIDDGIDKLKTAAEALAQSSWTYRDLFRQLVIVGYGPHLGGTIYPDIGIHFTTLPSWRKDAVAGLLNQINTR